jgi:hypothetical protein
MGTIFSRLARPLSIGGAVLAATTFASTAIAADPLLPVLVTSRADKTMKVRVYAGQARPCDSSSNVRIVDTAISPGQRIEASSPAFCVCVQQTTTDWPSSEWTMPQTMCRPLACTGWGKFRRCTPSGDPTIRVGVHNTR